MASTCPNVFQLSPRRDFQTFEALEYSAQGRGLAAVQLYCEIDEGWHTAIKHGVYDFDLHADWIELLHPAWNTLTKATCGLSRRFLKPPAQVTATPVDSLLGLAGEKLGMAADHRKLRHELGSRYAIPASTSTSAACSMHSSARWTPGSPAHATNREDSTNGGTKTAASLALYGTLQPITVKDRGRMTDASQPFGLDQRSSNDRSLAFSLLAAEYGRRFS
ncbi:MAG: hypothetical protein R2762_28665 [Bryobacteraceae bacterium]